MRRFTPWVALACIGTLAACTSGEGGTAGNTEFNVIVPTNAGTPDEIDIQTVEYTIACTASDSTAPFLDNNASFDETVRIDGNLEVTDGQTATTAGIPPEFGTPRPFDRAEIWQGFMDLPPGACNIQLRARDNDGEVICTTDEGFIITPDVTAKVNLVMICLTSFQAPVGSLDVDATFSFNVGNFCPDLFVLNCTDTDPEPQPLLPPPNPPFAATTCEVRFRDGDSTCGKGCDPQDCSPTLAGLSCTPGPDPNPNCPPPPGEFSCPPPDPNTGVSTTITCTDNADGNTALLICAGDMASSPSCTLHGNTLGLLPEFFDTPLTGGPFACASPANDLCFGGVNHGQPCSKASEVVDCDLAGDPTAECANTDCQLVAPGLPGIECVAGFCDFDNTNPRLNTSFVAACAPTALGGTPGATITCTAVTTDGDNDCDKTKTVTVDCPGLSPCTTFGGDAACQAAAGTACISSVCNEGTCDGATASDCCDDTVEPSGTDCSAELPPVAQCDGAGTCVSGSCADGLPDPDTSCSDGNECTTNTCNTGSGLCETVDVGAGASCNGGAGACDGGGVCIDNCSGADCSDGNDCTQDVCTSVGGPTCSNPNWSSGTTCDAGGGNVGACDGAGTCVFLQPFSFPLQSKDITVGCSNNVTGDVSILTFTMDVGPMSGQETQPFTAPLDGIGAFTETFLDAAQAVVPGGVKSAQLFDLAATVAVRSGATGADVVLGADFSVLAEQCSLTGAPCTGSPGQGSCTVIPSVTNVCEGGYATVPIINGTPNSPNGCIQNPINTPVPDCNCSACAALDSVGCRPGDPDVPCTKGDQCALNGFCVDGDLNVLLAGATGSYTAPSSGSTMSFGWYDGLVPPVTPSLLTLPAAVFAAPTPPVGLRVSAGGLFVALQCLQAEDSGLLTSGVTTCATGPNVGLPCDAPSDNSNNACDSGTDAGLACSQTSVTACTFGTPATIGCVNADCGSAGGIAHQCGPTDLAANTPDAALMSFTLP